MEMVSGSGGPNTTESSNGDCNAKFNTPVFVVVAILRAVSGSVSFFASLFVIFLILYFKKYIIFTQRLILYLSIGSMLNGLSIALQGANYFPDIIASTRYCICAGFFDQVTLWSVLLSICSITIDLYFNVVTKRQNRYEIFYIFLIFIVPLIFNWIPFINLTYGRAGPWCWIKKFNNDCTTDVFGKVLFISLWYLPLFLFIAGLVFVYIRIYFAIQKMKRSYQGTYNPKSRQLAKMMQKEFKPIIWFPIIFVVLNIFPIVNRLTDSMVEEPFVPLWFLDAILSPLQGALVSLVYALDPETRKRLKKCNLQSELKNNYGKSVHEYPFKNSVTDSYARTLTMSLKKKEHLLIPPEDGECGSPYHGFTN